jgi:hypothetical protein
MSRTCQTGWTRMRSWTDDMTYVSPFASLPRHQAGVILADPPWYFRTHSEKGWRKSAHAKYECMGPR